MTQGVRNEAELQDAIGRLPRALTPDRDLWPGIEARLTPRAAAPAGPARVRRWGAIAAALLVTFSAGLLLGRQAGDPPLTPVAATGQVPDAGESATLPMIAAVRASEKEYQAAFQVYTPLGVDPAWVEERTVQGIERSWAELRQAEEALVTALEQHPDNRFLSEKLLNLRAQQLEFMRQIYMLDQTSRRNT